MPAAPPANPLERVAPYTLRHGLLNAADLAELIAFAVANEAYFQPATLGTESDDGKFDPAHRASLILPYVHFEPWHGRIRAIVAPLLLDILHDLGMKPFDIGRYEIELVRHNDGDLYRRHIDTGKEQTKGRRAISLVYYFHAEPKAFEGGALRLYALTRTDIFCDIQPEQNRLVAFASWVPHEVMPISCPSHRFIDSRFAINCWVRAKPIAA